MNILIANLSIMSSRVPFINRGSRVNRNFACISEASWANQNAAGRRDNASGFWLKNCGSHRVSLLGNNKLHYLNRNFIDRVVRQQSFANIRSAMPVNKGTFHDDLQEFRNDYVSLVKYEKRGIRHLSKSEREQFKKIVARFRKLFEELSGDIEKKQWFMQNMPEGIISSTFLRKICHHEKEMARLDRTYWEKILFSGMHGSEKARNTICNNFKTNDSLFPTGDGRTLLFQNYRKEITALIEEKRIQHLRERGLINSIANWERVKVSASLV